MYIDANWECNSIAAFVSELRGRRVRGSRKVARVSGAILAGCEVDFFLLL